MSRQHVWVGDKFRVGLLLVALLGVGLVPTLSRGTGFVGSWKMALDAGLFSLTLVGPIAAGAACAVYARFTASGAASIVATGPHPWWTSVRPAIAVWSLAGAAMLAITVGTTTAARLAGSAAYVGTAWVVVPALCVLAAQVAVGVLLGATGRRTWLAPVAAAVVFGLGVLGSLGVLPDVFRVAATTGTYAGETFDVETLGLQAGAAAGTATALLALALRPALRASRILGGVVSAVVVGGVACVAILGHGTHEPTRLLAHPELVCRGEAVRVCLPRETTRPLDDLVARMETQAGALTRLGLALPPRYVGDATGGREQDGGVPLLDEEILASSVSDEVAARALATPARCAAYHADLPPPEASFDARRLLARWLLVRAGLLEPRPDDVDRAWLEAPPEEQRSWVIGTYERLRACDLDALRLPDGV